MLILAIETSCDETSIAFLESYFEANLDSTNFLEYINSFKILAHTISTQVKVHAEYGGVIPEIGARLHAEQIHFLFQQTVIEGVRNSLDERGSQLDNRHPQVDRGSPTTKNSTFNESSKFDFKNPLIQEFLSKINYICVTTEPGLKSALRVGEEFAKTIQFYIDSKLNKKTEIIKVNHLKGHVFSSFYKVEHTSPFGQPSSGRGCHKETLLAPGFQEGVSKSNVFPHLHLLVSGGNSQLILLQNPFAYQIVGQTLDDAAGECFDKAARMFGLKYPGGVSLARIAGLENTNYLDFPVSMKNNPDFNFSFSGLKTAVRYFVQKNELLNYEQKLTDVELDILINKNLTELTEPKLILIKKLCISIQSVITEQLSIKVKKAIKEFQPRSVGVSGGVSANLLLRHKIQKLTPNKTIFVPDLSLTGDNAVMIGLAGAVGIKNQMGLK